MDTFINLTSVDPASLRGSAVILFKHRSDQRVWVARSHDVSSRFDIIQRAVRNGHYGKGLIPKGLVELTTKPDDVLVSIVQTNKNSIDETYEHYVDSLSKQGLVSKRKRDCDQATYGFGKLTHPLYSSTCYYFKYKHETGFKRAVLALRHRCLELSKRKTVSKGLGQWMAGRSDWFINRLRYEVIPDITVVGSDDARLTLRRLVRKGKVAGLNVYNYWT